ncbi:MAG: hemolysin family protein [Acidimicrobiales bacterium]
MSLFKHKADEDPPPSRPGGRARGARSRGAQVARRGGRPNGRPGASGDSGANTQEELIIEALGDLRDTVVREVMTPRVDVVALTIPVTVEGVAGAVRETGHSCFPVCGDSLDDLIGVLFVNDLFRAGWAVNEGVTGAGGGAAAADAAAGGAAGATADSAAGGDGDESGIGAREEGRTGAVQDSAGSRAPSTIDISRRIRQPFLVPESHLVLDVLAEMRRQRRAFAVVVDEHGGVEGVITVKDLLGALVGDLPDEFDSDDEPELVRVDSNRWLLDGRMSVDDVRDRLGIAIPEGEYDTLGGYLFDGFGHIPGEGETLDIPGWSLKVAEMERHRIAKVVAKQTEPVGGPSSRTPEGQRSSRDANHQAGIGTGPVG